MTYAAGGAAGMGALSAFSSFKSSESQAAQYNAQAGLLDQEADQQIRAGASQANQQTKQGQQVQGQQVAAQGANGILSGSGSAAQTIADTGREADTAANTDIANAYRQASSTEYQAAVDRANAKTIGGNKLFGALLSGVSGGLSSVGGFNSLGLNKSIFS